MLIGIDVGTTAVKASLFDLNGKPTKVFRQKYETDRPSAGHVAQNASDWMRLVSDALTYFAKDLATEAVQGLGLCSQVNTHVFVDSQGKPLMPAFSWQDGRCADVAATLDARVSFDEKLRWWGAPLPIDASHVLARMAFVAKHHPDVWRQARWVLAPKDFCLMRLTGEVATDPMTAFGLVDGNLNPIQKLIDLVPGAAEKLPPLASFTNVIGQVRNGLPFAGAPVVTGAMDAWAGLLGAGVHDEGQALYLSGTSEILGIVSSQKTPVPGVIAFPKCEGILLHAGPTQSGGASVSWVASLLGHPVEKISELAESASTSKAMPVFLPHLEGERAPLWDINARACFAGLSSSSGAPELARAVLEGVAYSARLVMESLETSACVQPDVINHSGGGATSDIWCQIRADVLGRSIRRMATRDAGVLGAALMAGTGVGVFTSLQSATKSFVTVERTFEPNPNQQSRHYIGFENYKQLYQNLKPWNEERRHNFSA